MYPQSFLKLDEESFGSLDWRSVEKQVADDALLADHVLFGLADMAISGLKVGCTI